MKKSTIFLSVILLALIAAVAGCTTGMAISEEKAVELRPSMNLKAGEEVYACNCGAACTCHPFQKCRKMHLWRRYGEGDRKKCR